MSKDPRSHQKTISLSSIKRNFKNENCAREKSFLFFKKIRVTLASNFSIISVTLRLVPNPKCRKNRGFFKGHATSCQTQRIIKNKKLNKRADFLFILAVSKVKKASKVFYCFSNIGLSSRTKMSKDPGSHQRTISSPSIKRNFKN